MHALSASYFGNCAYAMFNGSIFQAHCLKMLILRSVFLCEKSITYGFLWPNELNNDDLLLPASTSLINNNHTAKTAGAYKLVETRSAAALSAAPDGK
mgnify:CR=1 FL=1